MKYIISYSVKKGVPNLQEMLGNDAPAKLGEYYSVYRCNIAGRITNPWRDKALRKLTGQHEEVKAFLMRCKRTQPMLNDFLYYLQSYQRKVVCIGCTGGKHRSVAMAEMLAVMAEAKGIEVTVIHRDLPKEEK